jgi:hypothetical protein
MPIKNFVVFITYSYSFVDFTMFGFALMRQAREFPPTVVQKRSHYIAQSGRKKYAAGVEFMDLF